MCSLSAGTYELFLECMMPPSIIGNELEAGIPSYRHGEVMYSLIRGLPAVSHYAGEIACKTINQAATFESQLQASYEVDEL